MANGGNHNRGENEGNAGPALTPILSQTNITAPIGATDNIQNDDQTGLPEVVGVPVVEPDLVEDKGGRGFWRNGR